uniref:EF-hand domain-containing protein n=1 Tax=Phaeomonas parva TaxID=124430 RepID=A0A6U4JTB8_9STRA|mmetsp:Transcript_42288/g.132474  ORF Transcript_42288/g.132474 Transcript_42288/m.132474 type:complete len:121 (+) Transcript_42288:550-912(+)|eukprot:CAMPEP_0118852674 /NCGR_PEP_ID=MMETSP1163-20130328/1578_1 /TAXON_ID=124430 /ORGANISM="Phaeomonas parva, Strain CCMP2877" /LENGTH=120 /DNA_ID=CAMNT_0006785129 /DNA_START=310 /DNA_END=672 /DNA_ORIENTATION=+
MMSLRLARPALRSAPVSSLAVRSCTTTAMNGSAGEAALRESFLRYRRENYGTLCSSREMIMDMKRAVDPEMTSYVQEAQLRQVLANIDAQVQEEDIQKLLTDKAVEGQGIPMTEFVRLLR